ncbi:MAG: short-chain dehydrogenase [Novosphingobium sp. 28-62-57]|uniref:SDR family NAD(P)-dependent oxidoreductase n=1 Tax=unclassified Novosphingobium TaxID=2644732 RepID=UPI000BD6E932|nr:MULTISPECIES: SDR family NAD(P)-dependent oxidoreductase [unclassified Novosphingobium]OYW51461.1 MAG: short-chain dehydrogenase [Novosphingobium sp. 12-62-10]OYZ10404.1 MAG: short-chain dehydrogenase [Novosphingobium sp. 28-62-57]OZA40717.1 MAG: short-chain dehydrogenase [Novosphingobium sp. 17-62-9]HQS68195.1 SDR family NAD(P)-dependent oxidoreductase [Novosphingobium sp.]
MTANTQSGPFAHALDFTGKTVLVTGGGVGIGRAIAEAFADAGAQVVIAEIDPARADQAEAAMPSARVIRCDVRQRGVGAMLAERIAAETGKLDVLVNNVGHFVHARPFAMLEDEEAEEILDTNLGQLLRMTRAMIPLLRKAGPGANIINVTSIEAHRGIPYCSVYAAAKWAVTGFTKSLALELGPEGIRVNTIAPETTDTPQVALDYMIPPENRAHEERWIPLGRFGQPSDSAGAALYLASPLAAWVTGTALNVDGGALAAGGWYRTPQGEWTNVPLISGNGLVIPGTVS